MNQWDRILHSVERRVNPHSFNTWFRPSRLELAEEGRLVVRVPTRLFRKRLTETYGDVIQAVLAELRLVETRIEYLCSDQEAAETPQAQARLDFEAVSHQLNPRYTFESFIVGASNQFAHAAAQAVADQPSK
ncbi:MAG TPA: DnaA N-terminal domain-containing protein, partial [Candidatus Acidoferrales bacterium]|nr:DnaA N-terminal domain-containing protein [Candidatus Acidoferrales bacterium]